MRLIDADALPREKMLAARGNGQYEDVDIVYGDDIDNAPTIDPVRNGRWEVAGNTTHYYTCSLCGKPGDGFDNYCRSCGAKMDGGKD